MQVAALVVMGTDNIVISVFLGVGSVAAYAVAFQLYALAVAALWSGVDVLLPFFARWGAQRDERRLRSAFLRATKYAMSGTVLAAILAIVCSESWKAAVAQSRRLFSVLRSASMVKPMDLAKAWASRPTRR